MQIVVLCGGKGSRLKELNGETPKILTEFNNSTYLEILVNYLKEFDELEELVLLTGYGHDQVKGKLIDIKAHFRISAYRDEVLGGGGSRSILGAVKQNLLQENFVLIFGDSLPQFNIQQVFNKFVSNNLEMMMTYIDSNLVKEIPRIAINRNRVSYSSKAYPEDKYSMVDYGVTFFNLSALSRFVNNNNLDLKILIEKITENHYVYGYKAKKPYIEFGNLESYKVAYQRFLDLTKWKI